MLRAITIGIVTLGCDDDDDFSLKALLALVALVVVMVWTLELAVTFVVAAETMKIDGLKVGVRGINLVDSPTLSDSFDGVVDLKCLEDLLLPELVILLLSELYAGAMWATIGS